MSVEQQPPLVLAMIVADTVLHDLLTDKMTIQGTYQVVRAESFPYRHPSLVVYVALTEGYGETSVRLRLVDVDEADAPILELESVLDFADPFDVLQVVFAPASVVFPEPGDYRLQLFGAGEPLLERRLQVRSVADSNET